MSPPVRLPAAIAGVLLVLYAFTICPTVGPGDSGELSVAASTWGVAHAPGYPLLTLAGNLVTHLAPFAEPGLVLNLLNAAFAAAACAVLAAAVVVMTGSAAAGLVAGLSLGTSRVFWLQSLAFETFALNALMAALLLLFLSHLVQSADSRRPALWTVPASVLVATAVLTHHTTLILLAVPVLAVKGVLLLRIAGRPENRLPVRRVVTRSAIFAALGLLPLLYIPIASHFDPPLNWGNVRSVDGLLDLILRKDFGTGTLMAPGIAVQNVLFIGDEASPLGQKHLFAFLAGIPAAFGWFFPVLAVIGLIRTVRRSPWLALTGVGFMALLGIFFTRVNTPFVPFYALVTERFFILPHVVLAFFAGCGVQEILDRLPPFRLKSAVVAGVALIATAGVMAAVNATKVSQRGNTFTRDFGANLMAGMPPRTIFLSTGDMGTNSFAYQRFALHRRPDLTQVNQIQIGLGWYVDALRRQAEVLVPETATPEPVIRSWIEANAGRPMTAVTVLDDSYSPHYRLLPFGVWSRIVPAADTTDLKIWESSYSEVVRQWDLATLDRTFPEGSWEDSEAVFYRYALGQLLGLRDLIEIVEAEKPESAVPALDRAARWTGKWRADLLAHRADFLRGLLDESPVRIPSGSDLVIATRAFELAEESLRDDPENLQALKTLAALRASRPELRDLIKELDVRQRIVDLCPGYPSVLIPYFRLARAVAAADAGSAPSVLGRAEAVRIRFVGLLNICVKLDSDPGIRALRDRWSTSLDRVPDLQ